MTAFKDKSPLIPRAFRPVRIQPRKVFSVGLAFFLALALLSLISCRESAPTPSSSSPPSEKGLEIGYISTELHSLDRNGEPLKLEIALNDFVGNEVRQSKSLVLVTGSASEGKAKLGLTARLLPDGFTGKLHAFVMAKITNTGSIPLRTDLEALKENSPDGGVLKAEDYTEHLRKAVSDAISALDEQAQLLSGGNELLFKTLEHSERDMQVTAIHSLRKRKSSDAVQPLCNLLKREQNEIGQTAIGALVAIGDEKAVPCIIQWADSDDRRLLMIIEPLYSLGGEEARQFLEMVASAHDDTRIRRVAEAGLKRLKQGNSQDHPEKSP